MIAAQQKPVNQPSIRIRCVKAEKHVKHVGTACLEDQGCSSVVFLSCALWRPPAPGARPGAGAGPRGVTAARDVKLVPDIYLTLPGLSDAPRPEFLTADTLEDITSVCRDTTEKVCLEPDQPTWKFKTGQMSPLGGEARAACLS
ncbi:hypothetical protein AMECASPLE_001172 [Ameca splendens]|uniref:Uncharacterized protein n=1 Tax=Ameca splendens TaxID=208324 RepID=A0ABV0Y8U4_9TELE